jgi:hypothetical protein
MDVKQPKHKREKKKLRRIGNNFNYHIYYYMVLEYHKNYQTYIKILLEYYKPWDGHTYT